MMRYINICILFLCTSLPLLAQDQTINLTGFKANVTSLSTDVTPICHLTNLTTSSAITDSDVAAMRHMAVLISQRLNITFQGNDTAIVHLVKWGDVNIANQVWFVVTANGRWIKQNATGARLFGIQRPLLIYVYSGLSMGVDQVAYKITSTNKRPENLQHVIDLAKAVAAGTLGPFIEPTNVCAWGGDLLFLNHTPADVTIQAFAQKHAKAPETPSLTAVLAQSAAGGPIDQLQIQRSAAANAIIQIKLCKAGACTPSVNVNAAGIAAFPASFCQRSVCTATGLDSMNVVKGQLVLGPLDELAFAMSAAAPQPPAGQPPATVQTPETGKKLFNNEDLGLWDVSVMMQVNKVSDVQFNATDNTVQPAKIDKQNLYAMADIFPLRNFERNWRVKGEFISLPLAVGVPFSKTPLDRPFFGAGLGTRKFQFMGGISYESIQQPRTLAVGTPTTPAKLQANLTSRRVAKLMLGLNVSVASIVNGLTKK